jgi:uncharacterized protein YndB with AHSA1/START domain
MATTYHFESRWRVKARAEEVYDIIGQPLEYPRWWPAVYLQAEEIPASAPNAAGRRVRLHTKGWLPYTLRWEAQTIEAVPPRRIAIEASGDLDGRGVWTFAQDGDYVDIRFDWNVTVGKSIIRRLTPMLRPAFESNHKWAMQQGEISLREELIRYRARVPQDLLEAADPRGPVEVPVHWIAAGAVALTAIACIAIVRGKSRTSETSPA